MNLIADWTWLIVLLVLYGVGDLLMVLAIAPKPKAAEGDVGIANLKLVVRRFGPIGFLLFCGGVAGWGGASATGWGDHGAVGVILTVISVPLLLGTAFSPPHFLQSTWQWGLRFAILVGFAIQSLHPCLPLLFTILVVGFYRLQGTPIHISITDKALVLVAHFAGSLSAILMSLYPNFTEPQFIGVLLAVTGACYAKPAWSKILHGWFPTNRLSNLTVAAEAQNGWMKRWPHRKALRARIDKINGIILIATLMVELSVLSIALHPAVMWCFAIAICGFHVGVFALSGILFWKWMYFVLALAYFATKWGSFGLTEMGYCALGALGIGLMTRMVQGLTWFDSPVSHRFEFVGVDERGEETRFAPEDFGPFDFPVAQARFNYLINRPTMVGCFGAVFSKDHYRALKDCRSLEDYDEVMRAKGENQFDPKRADELDRVLVKFARSNYPIKRPLWNRYLPIPAHIWSMIPSFRREFAGESIQEIRVYYAEFLRQNQLPVLMRRELLREVKAGN